MKGMETIIFPKFPKILCLVYSNYVDTIENETKLVDAKKTAVQDAGRTVKEENVKCNCDG